MGRITHTYGAHAWLQTLGDWLRVNLESENSLEEESASHHRWLLESDFDSLDDQLAAFKIDWPSAHKLIECSEFGAPEESLLGVLLAADPSTAVTPLFSKEFGAFKKFCEAHDKKANKVTMPAFAELARAAAPRDAQPVVYDRTHPAAAAALNVKPMLPGSAKRKREAQHAEARPGKTVKHGSSSRSRSASAAHA